MTSSRRRALERSFKYASWLLLAAVAFVFLDYLVDVRPSTVSSSYRFGVKSLALDEARILRQDNLAIIVIRRSPETIARLKSERGELQDPDSKSSRQPAFAANATRAREAEYFVAYAIGTDLGCPLAVEQAVLREVCGQARYDFAGRALRGQNAFKNLTIPDYNFSDDYLSLIIRP